MILFLPYSPDPSYLPRRKETIEWLQSHVEELTSRGWRIVECPCEGDDDYENGFRSLWGEDDLIILEHDVVPTLDALLALADCGRDLCAQAYQFYFRSNDAPGEMLGFNMCRVVLPGGAQGYVPDGADQADFVGFGMTKIARHFQVNNRLDLPAGRWGDLDSRFCEWVRGRGFTWHVHWPYVKHNQMTEG